MMRRWFYSPTDEQLAARSVSGSTEQVRRAARLQLYDRHGFRTLAYLAARLPAEAWESAQCEIWRRVAGTTGRIPADLIGTARSLIHCRSSIARRSSAAERMVRLRAALAQLDGEHRQLLRLRWANASPGDMARATGHRPEFALRLAVAAEEHLQSIWAGERLILCGFPALRGDLCHWLERQLVGGQLADLIAELSAVHAVTARRQAFLPPLLRGPRKSAVLESGLAELSERRLVALLRYPRLLLPMQELVLAFGGDYWNSVRPIDSKLDVFAARARRQLESRAA